jgi:magnesium transporter
MAFVSELIGKPVTDVDGNQVGVLQDLIARQPRDFKHPIIEAISVRTKNGQIVVPYDDVAVLLSPAIPLKHKFDNIPSFDTQKDDIYIQRDVLDKQIIDTNGARVVRVNDVELVRINSHVFVSNVDIGSMGILRRIGLSKAADAIFSGLHKKAPQNYISWDFVELLLRDQFMRLKVPGDKISDLHPADIAEIISDLSHDESGQLLESLDIEHLADALEEVEPDFQATLVESMSDEKVADVLEEMSPDEAADLLAELPKERSEDLLELMQDEEAEDVRKLLAYPEDSAGGLMTTDIATIRPGLTTSEAIEDLRKNADEAESIFYVYVTDEEEHLLGVVSLSDIVLAKPDTPVFNIMHKRVISANVEDDQTSLAQIVAKYNLMTIPVVDEDNHLLGMVTADDALDKIIPTAWKKKLPRFYYMETA